jgi:uncharacterized protein YndB with AHSA1/START domain
MKREGSRSSPAHDASGHMGAGICETAVRKATGKGWGDWYDLLDAAGARDMSHRQILVVVARHEASVWWQQMIAVAYEQARGLREKHQKDDGFAATVSKVVKAGVARVYAAWTEDEVRAGWLDASGWNIRKATPCRSLHITWKDGRTHLEVHLHPRGEGRSIIQVEHARLTSLDDVHRLKAFWGVALERLRELLETADQPHSLAA